MNDLDDYILSLENADLKLTEQEWRDMTYHSCDMFITSPYCFLCTQLTDKWLIIIAFPNNKCFALADVFFCKFCNIINLDYISLSYFLFFHSPYLTFLWNKHSCTTIRTKLCFIAYSVTACRINITITNMFKGWMTTTFRTKDFTTPFIYIFFNPMPCLWLWCDGW